MNKNLKFVPKEIDTPNVSQVHLIENLWTYLTQKVYERGWEAKEEERRIKNRRIESKNLSGESFRECQI